MFGRVESTSGAAPAARMQMVNKETRARLPVAKHYAEPPRQKGFGMDTEPQGRRVLADDHAVIEPRPATAHQIILEPPVGMARRLDLKELFGRDPRLLASFEADFRAQVDTSEEHECWIWTGITFQATGYGRVSAVLPDGTKKDLMAHRVAFVLANDIVIPQYALVRHHGSCKTRLCCNPKCLYLGDYKGNAMPLKAAA